MPAQRAPKRVRPSTGRPVGRPRLDPNESEEAFMLRLKRRYAKPYKPWPTKSIESGSSDISYQRRHQSGVKLDEVLAHIEHLKKDPDGNRQAIENAQTKASYFFSRANMPGGKRWTRPSRVVDLTKEEIKQMRPDARSYHLKMMQQAADEAKAHADHLANHPLATAEVKELANARAQRFAEMVPTKSSKPWTPRVQIEEPPIPKDSAEVLGRIKPLRRPRNSGAEVHVPPPNAPSGDAPSGPRPATLERVANNGQS